MVPLQIFVILSITVINIVFECINIRRMPGKVFEHEPCGLMFKHLPRDPANVNARKNMVDRYS